MKLYYNSLLTIQFSSNPSSLQACRQLAVVHLFLVAQCCMMLVWVHLELSHF